jgi:anti-sigma28 factor (negative regulator of flagellin synthesis)
MRIDGLSQQPKTPQSGKRGDAAQVKKAPARAGDVVEISTSTQGVADLAAKAKVAVDETSASRLEAVRARVQSGHYNTPETRKQIAGALLQSGGFKEVAADLTQARGVRQQVKNTPDVRKAEVERARQRVSSGFYQETQVRQATAERVVDQLA